MVLIYVNKEKDIDGAWYNLLCDCLKKENIEYQHLTDDDFDKKIDADAIFVLGGDGTILALTEFSVKNDTPIIAVNAGKGGFLTEFERIQTEHAVKSFVNNTLVKDARTVIQVEIDGKVYYALNDIYVERLFDKNSAGVIVDLFVEVDGGYKFNMRGDGLVVSTPTGSTAYSVCSGGAVVAPDANVLMLTPISAMPLSLKPFVYNDNKECFITITKNVLAGLFVDGKYICNLTFGNKISVKKSSKTLVFLRERTTNLYNKLTKKLN